MKIFIFGREGCPVCKSIKEKMEYFSQHHTPLDTVTNSLSTNPLLARLSNGDTPIAIEYFDVDTVAGLTESAYRSVPEIPAVILMKGDKEIKRWVQSAPIFSELKELLQS